MPLLWALLALGVSRDLASNALTHAEATVETSTRSSCEIVVAEYGHALEVADLAQRFALPHGCEVFAYSKKSNSCATIRQEQQRWEQQQQQQQKLEDGGGTRLRVTCMELANVGNEQHTYAHHVATRYNSLAERVYFVALPLNGSHSSPRDIHDNRLTSLRDFMSSASGFGCICYHNELSPNWGFKAACPQQHVSDVDDFQMDGPYIAHNKDTMIVPADPRPLGVWATVFLNLSASSFHRTPICYEGLAATTRQLIHARPRETYAAIERALSKDQFPEAAHFMERLMFATYGGGASRIL